MRCALLLAGLMCCASCVAAPGCAMPGLPSACGPAGCPAPQTDPTWQAVVQVIKSDSRAGRWSFTVNSAGTGVLFSRSADVGLVLTAQHTLRDPGDAIWVIAAGRRYQAAVLGEWPEWDLALLAIEPPPLEPRPLADYRPEIGQAVWTAGFAGGQRLHFGPGRVVGYARPRPEADSDVIQVTSQNVSGDSGGPILDQKGRIVGVAWGARDGVATGTVATRIRAVLATVASETEELPPAPSAPRAVVPLEPVREPEAAEPEPEPVEPTAPVEEPQPAYPPQWPANKKPEVEEPAAKPSEESGASTPASSDSDPPAIAADPPTSRWDLGSLGDVAYYAVMAAMAAIGISVPAGLGGWATWLAWRGARRLWRRLRAAASSGETGGPADAAASFPRDATEARQILRLSQSEGRSPLHDALVGRFVFDELDQAIDSSGPDAEFAASFKRRVEDRFNQLAPLSVTERPDT